MKLAFVLLATLLTSFQLRADVKIETAPQKISALKTETGLILNFDLLLTNSAATEAELVFMELYYFDASGELLSLRSFGSNGLPGSINTLSSRSVPAQGKTTIFNPIQTISSMENIAEIKGTLYFKDGRRSEFSRDVSFFKPFPLSFPLQSQFFIGDGDDYYSHHRRVSLTHPIAEELGLTAVTQRFAHDIAIVDTKGNYRTNYDDRSRENWLAWGAKVYAPANGTIALVQANMPDNLKSPSGDITRPSNYDSFGSAAGGGNQLTLELEDGSYLMMAHFMEGDLQALKVGDTVKEGQYLGRIGLSGDTYYPHLHMQRQSGIDILTSEGFPLTFTCIELAKHDYRPKKDIHLTTGDIGRHCTK